MSFGTQILDKSDLNSYKEPGNYYCSGSLAAQQLINSPTKNAFVMKVELGTGINYPTQTITSFGDGKKYFRVYIPENTEWRNWVEYVTNTDLNAKALGTSNLNDIKNPGTYFQTHSGNATVDRSYPVEDAGFLEVMFAESGFILQKYNTHSSAAVYKRTYNNSGWNGWKQV